MMWKICIFGLLGLFAISSQTTTEVAYEESEAACITEMGIKPEDFFDLKHDAVSNGHKFTCYVACVLKKRGSIRDNAEPKAITPKSVPLWVTNADPNSPCFNERAEDECKTAEKILNCLVTMNVGTYYRFFENPNTQPVRHQQTA